MARSMTWASNRTTVDELKTLPGTQGFGAICVGVVAMVLWTVLALYSGQNISPRALDAVLWTGEVLFFWGCAQYLYWNARRIYRQLRIGDRRLPSGGRRATDRVEHAASTAEHDPG